MEEKSNKWRARVGEEVRYTHNHKLVVVARAWSNADDMRAEVDPVFRDSASISTDYLLLCMDHSPDARRAVLTADANAWYEVMWYEYEFMRVIVPHAHLEAERRRMVTDEDPGGLPAPGDWARLREGDD